MKINLNQTQNAPKTSPWSSLPSRVKIHHVSHLIIHLLMLKMGDFTGKWGSICEKMMKTHPSSHFLTLAPITGSSLQRPSSLFVYNRCFCRYMNGLKII